MPPRNYEDYEEIGNEDLDKCPNHDKDADRTITYNEGEIITYECGCAICCRWSVVDDDSITYHGTLAQAEGVAELHDQTVQARGY